MEIWTKVLAILLMPPGILILAALFGLLVHIRSSFLGNIIVSTSVTCLLVLSLPVTGRLMLAPLEQDAPVLAKATLEKIKKEANAIIVISGDRNADAPEYGGDTIGQNSLARVRYAAWLQKNTTLPILVSGGSPYNEPVTLAEIMQKVLTDDFNAEVKWVEKRSSNTFENAQFSREILQKEDIKTIILVTDAYHMKRAHWAFKKVGFNVIPAPTGFATPSAADRKIFGYLPSAKGLALARKAVHERLGLRWYMHKYGDYVARGTEKTGTDAAKPAAASTP